MQGALRIIVQHQIQMLLLGMRRKDSDPYMQHTAQIRGMRESSPENSGFVTFLFEKSGTFSPPHNIFIAIQMPTGRTSTAAPRRRRRMAESIAAAPAAVAAECGVRIMCGSWQPQMLISGAAVESTLWVEIKYEIAAAAPRYLPPSLVPGFPGDTRSYAGEEERPKDGVVGRRTRITS